ncbi:MAG TPA: SelB C-terminal domain-containing protein, partial [Stellaceae bacterium]|nr:SelB C-terminal domain-containing protein [Stellaceae bacterium]
AGERCAVNIVGSFPEGGEPGRGDWLIDPALHRPSGRLDLMIRVSRQAPAPLRDGLPLHLHLGTEDAVARAAVLGARAIAPGETGFVQLDIERPVAALWGDRAILRDHAARHTLAGGRVLDPAPPRRGRSRPERLAALAALAEPDPGDALEKLVAAGGIVPLAPFALARNLPLVEIAALAEAGDCRLLGAGAAAVAVSPARLAEIEEALAAALAEMHRAQPDALGVARAALVARLHGAPSEAVCEAALAGLTASGRVVRERALLRLAEHQPRLGREDERLWQEVAPLLTAGGLRPPRVRELASALSRDPDRLTRALKRIERFGHIAAVAPNRFFLPDTIAQLAGLAQLLASESEERSFTAQLFKDRSGIGRNLTIEVLEYLDTIGVTRRVGDARTILRDPGEMFG